MSLQRGVAPFDPLAPLRALKRKVSGMARSKTFKMRLTADEHDRLMQLAADHRLSAADLVRAAVLGAPDKLPSRDLLKDILRQLTGVATNLNQAQKSTNEAAKAGTLSTDQAKAMYDAIAFGAKAWKTPRDQLLKFMKT